MAEKFDPSDPKYKKVEDLPEAEQKRFKNVEDGFVKKTVATSEGIIEKKKVDALVEDISRSATEEEYKNLKSDHLKGEPKMIGGGLRATDVYNTYTGLLGGHEIKIRESRQEDQHAAVCSYDLEIDGEKITNEIGGINDSSRFELFFRKIRKERGDKEWTT